MIATPRWKKTGWKPARWFRKERHVFKMNNGLEFEVVGDKIVSTIVEQLPLDYLDLGNEAADMKQTLGTSERQATARLAEAEKEIRHLVQRIEADPGKVVPILSADLEKAINMLIRFAQALGMQAQGALYDEVQALASKYGMSYRAPNQRQVREQAYVRDVLGADVVTGALNHTTGKMEFYPTADATIIDGAVYEAQDELPFPPSTRGYLLENNDDPANWAVDERKLEESVDD